MKKTTLGKALIKAAKETIKPSKEEVSIRYLVVYTPNFCVTPFKVVYDSSKKKNFAINSKIELNSSEAAYKYYRGLKDEDSEIRIFRVFNLTDEEVLKFMNCSAEMAVPNSMYWSRTKGLRPKNPEEQ